jgi:hypothetical protein
MTTIYLGPPTVALSSAIRASWISQLPSRRAPKSPPDHSPKSSLRLWNASRAKSFNECLLNVRFRIKIFRVLHITVSQPKVVTVKAKPIDIAGDARAYRLSFDLGDVPLTDHIGLEVLSPAGEPLTKFKSRYVDFA